MKNIQTALSTGDTVYAMFNAESQLTGKIGVLKHGKISIHWKLTEYSGFTEQISTRSLNSRMKANKISTTPIINDK